MLVAHWCAIAIGVMGVEGWRGLGLMERHTPRRSRSGGLQAACDAAEQRGFGAGGGEGDAHRVAVSVMRAAILSSRSRSVVNSALASGCGLGMASRSVSISQ